MTLYQVSLVMVSSLICTCVSNTLTEEDLKVPQLLHHYDNLLQNFCRDTVTDVLHLDFSKAFDKVDHQILLRKLHKVGIRGKLFDWIGDFLKDRMQCACPG